jgi:hypothetical protein
MLPSLQNIAGRPEEPMSTLRKEGTDTSDEFVASGRRFYD